jgi:hypothetical protein
MMVRARFGRQMSRDRNCALFFNREAIFSSWGLLALRYGLLLCFEALAADAPLSVEMFYSTRGLFLLLVVLIILAVRVPPEKSGAALTLPMAIVMCAAPFLPLVPLPALHHELALVGAVLGGASLVWSYLQCIYVYKRLSVQQITVYVLISFALASVVRFPLEVLPIELAVVLIVPLPFLCRFMCRKALAELDHKPSVSYPSGESQFAAIAWGGGGKTLGDC